MSDFEKSIIDGCLSDKKALYRVISELRTEDFESAVCRKAFSIMSCLVKSGDPVTIETLHDRDNSIHLDLFSADSPLSKDNFNYYIGKVQEQGKGKRLKQIIAKCQNIIEGTETSADEKIQLVQDIVSCGFTNTSKDEMDTSAIGDTVIKRYKEQKKRREAGEDIVSLSTGINQLDNVIGGWQPGTLTVIGGRQGHGKSTLAMDFSFKLILEGHPTLYISLEQGSIEIFLYHIQKYTTYSPLSIKQGNLTPDQEPLLKKAIEKFSKLPLFISDNSRTLSDIVNTVRSLHLAEGIEVVILDYLQLIENPRKGEPRHVEVAGISRTLKRLAMELNIAIIALSQLNKEPESRASKRIYLSDTRESEAITQDADYVIFLYRPEIYGDREKDYISLAKNRHGSTIDKIYLRWNVSYNRYSMD